MLTIDLDLDDSGVSSEFILQSQPVWTIIFFSSLLNGQDGMAIGHFLDVVASLDLHAISDPLNSRFGVTSERNLNDHWFSLLKGTDFLESRWYIDFGWSCKEDVREQLVFAMEPLFRIIDIQNHVSLPLMFRFALETLDPPLLKTLAEYSSASSPNTSLIISIWRLPSSMISNLWSSKISLEPLYLKQMIFVYVQRKNINSILYYYLFCITSKHSILGCTWTRKQKTVYTSNKITTKSSTFTLYNHYAKRIKKKILI